MSKSREERRAKKQERLQRDKENRGNGAGHYAVSKNGHEFDFFKSREREGTDLHLDIIPYIIQETNHPEVLKKNMDVGDEDYMLEYARHNDLGPEQKWNAVCLRETLGKPCPICEMIDREVSAGADINDLPKAKRRVLYNVIDRDRAPGKIQIFDVSYHLFHRELKDKLDRYPGGWFDFSDVDEGKTVKAYCYRNTMGRGFTSYKEFDFMSRDPLAEDMIDKAIPLEKLLTIHTYGELEAMMQGQDIAQDEPAPAAAPAAAAPAAAPAAEPEAPAAAAPDTAPATGQGIEYGQPCPYNLTFGVDIDNPEHKKTCGATCADATWEMCRAAADARKGA